MSQTVLVLAVFGDLVHFQREFPHHHRPYLLLSALLATHILCLDHANSRSVCVYPALLVCRVQRKLGVAAFDLLWRYTGGTGKVRRIEVFIKRGRDFVVTAVRDKREGL